MAAGAGGRQTPEAQAVGPRPHAFAGRLGTVAGAAGEAGVGALKGEARGGVVEGDGAPGLDSVARLAAADGGPAVDLAAVGVPVAGGAAGEGEAEAGGLPVGAAAVPDAVGRQRAQFLRTGRRARRGRQLGARHLRVAGVARHREVGAGEREVRLLVLVETEGRGNEAGDGVALRAAARVRGELAGVGIGVAGGAALERRLGERVEAPAGDRHRDRPAGIAAVAGAAAQLGVLAAQREAGAVVIEAGAVDAAPAGGRVARSAGRAEPAAVGIGVAVRAGVEVEAAEPPDGPAGRGVPPAWVALPAPDLPVAPGEREAGAVVVEAAHEVPPLDRVARRAGASGELPAVRVGVAVRARPEVEPGEPPEGLAGGVAGLAVAALAGDPGVGAGEREGGGAVVEAGRRPPRLHPVAVGARAIGELPPVLVTVAGGAGGREPEEGPVEVDAGGAQAGIRDVPGPVAVAAAGARVRPPERPAGQTVVEGVATALAPEDQLEVAAVVLDVAGLAAPVVGPRVEPLAGGDPAGERPVALEALLGDHAPARRVAIEAVRGPLQLGVGAAQRTGRELGRRRGRDEQDEHGRQAPPPHDPPPKPKA